LGDQRAPEVDPNLIGVDWSGSHFLGAVIAIDKYYPLSLEKHLLNFLDLGLKENGISALHELIADIKNRGELSYDNAIQILNGIIGNTVKYLVESHMNISDIFGENYHVYQQLADQETLEEVKTWLIEFYTRIFEYQEKPIISVQTHIARILDYVHENYHKDIDINTLADYVGLSYSHVRKIFYDETKDNIVNYINKLRIEEAKHLLWETDQTVNEIALNLGYNNNQSFNRFFKKYEGVTPGEFWNIRYEK
jgi:AraC-like DNA-binding protein